MEGIFRIVHISDLHVGRYSDDISIEENIKTLEEKLKKIIKKYEGSESCVIVITGDIFDMHYSEYRKKAVTLFEKIQILKKNKVFCCPGNHYSILGGEEESPTLVKSDSFFFPNDFPNLVQIEKQNCIFRFIGLDSTIQRPFPSGEIGEEQISFLRKVFESTELEKERSMNKKSELMEKNIVYLHHSPFCDQQGHIIKDREQFLGILEGKCDVLLFGHVHKQDRLVDKETEHKIPVILSEGKLLEIEKFREIIFFRSGDIMVKEIPFSVEEKDKINE